MTGMDHWDDPEWTRALLAVENLDVEELTHALEQAPDLDVNVSGFKGWTLLNYAIDAEVTIHQESGRSGEPPASVSLVLVSHGADPNLCHPEGWSSVDLARRRHHVEFLRSLDLE